MATLLHHVAEVRSSNRELVGCFPSLECEVAGLRVRVESDVGALQQGMDEGFARVHDRLDYLSGKVDHYVKLSARDRAYMDESLYDRKAEAACI